MTTQERKLALLDALAEGLPLTAACKKIGVSRNAYYKWRKADADFADMCDAYIGVVKDDKEQARKEEEEKQKAAIEQAAQSSGLDLEPESMIARYNGVPAPVLRNRARKQIVAALEAAGLYNDSLQPAINTAASCYAAMMIAFAALDKYDPLQIQLSSNGSPKLAYNPALSNFNNVQAKYLSALRALGLTLDAKVQRPEQDALSAFMENLNSDDD